MIQKLLATVCLFLCSVSACSAQSAGKSQNDSIRIAAKLSLSKSSVRAGESVPAKIEISNTGELPVLIANRIFMSITPAPSNVVFEMKDDHGKAIRGGGSIIDFVPRLREPNLAIGLLKELQVLNPGYSLSTVFMLDTNVFAMSNPGTYRLSASYSSGGFSYPPALTFFGLTENDVKSLPWTAWRGKIQTNQVTFRVTSSGSRARRK
jgi:hypothetical protein